MSETDPSHPEPAGALAPPPPGAAASPPRRLFRDPHGPIGGVASGMAAYFEIDPVIVRLMWIVALLTGIGFFAYLVSWLVIPKARLWPPQGYAQPVTRDNRSAAMASGLAIVALAALIGMGIDGMGDLLLPAALIGFGLYLLNERNSRADAPGAAGAAAPPPGAGATWTEGGTTSAAPYVNHASAGAVDGPSSLVTPTVLSLLAIAAGVYWALAAAGLLQTTVAGLAAGGLLLVGLGLLASLWLGRAPGLMLLGMSLTGVLLVASAVEPWVQRAREFQAVNMPNLKLDQVHGAGDQRFDPQSLAELEPVYGLGLGELTLDLSALDFTGTTHDVEIQVGMGRATVIVPEDVNVEVDGHVAMGKASALDITSEGIGAAVQTSDAALDAGTLRVKFAVGLGEGMVRREE